jgi:hypothetical protein
MAKTELTMPDEVVERRILLARGQKVLLDSDLASLYGVTTKRLNEQVKRNIERFPEDFMFQLTADEHDALRSQIATLKTGRGQHRKYRAFRVHGTWCDHGRKRFELFAGDRDERLRRPSVHSSSRTLGDAQGLGS